MCGRLTDDPHQYSKGSSVATFDISPSSSSGLSTLVPVQSETYHLSGPGTVDYRQDSPHPHHAIMDPSGKFLLVPDLGADLVRVYLMNNDGRLRFTALAPLVVPVGSGPRHGAFLVTEDGSVFFYLTSEIENTITGYRVTYTSSSTVDFQEVYRSGSHGIGGVVPYGVYDPDHEEFPVLVGEVQVSVSLAISFLPPPFFLVVSFSIRLTLMYLTSLTGISSSCPPATKKPSPSQTRPTKQSASPPTL